MTSATQGSFDDRADELHRELRLPAQARLAVLGKPIAHSRSPRIHAAAYAELGVDWTYGAIECSALELEALLVGITGGAGASQNEHVPWRGLSLTMPLKEEAHRIAAVVDPVARESGVVNTLLHLSNDSWAGYNTDVGGLAAALEGAALDPSDTVILGAGATAVSALLAARSLGSRRVTLVARRVEAAEAVAERFGGASGTRRSVQPEIRVIGLTDPSLAERAPSPSLVISTLPGAAAQGLILPSRWVSTPLFDVAYDPWPSPLAERWRNEGGQAHSGLEMLVQQAMLQVRIFVNGDPGLPLEREVGLLAAMRRAATADVEE